MHFTLIRWTWSFPQWNTSLVLAHCLCSVHSEWPEPISLSTHHLNCTLLTTFNGNIGTSYFFSKHILWLFFFQFKVIMMPPYGKIPEPFLPSSKRATGTFILPISKLILHAAHVLNIPRRCALKSRATNTPMKNEAFKAASWCSKFESTLNNKENQH